MPFSIKSTGGGAPYKVINKVTRKVHGTHPTLDKAKAQLRALYANVPDASSSNGESRRNAEKMHGPM